MGLGLGKLWLNLPVLCYMPAIPGNVTIMLLRKLYYAHIMLNYVTLTQGLGQATCKLAD